jgi:hypothetical protein
VAPNNDKKGGLSVCGENLISGDATGDAPKRFMEGRGLPTNCLAQLAQVVGGSAILIQGPRPGEEKADAERRDEVTEEQSSVPIEDAEAVLGKSGDLASGVVEALGVSSSSTSSSLSHSS